MPLENEREEDSLSLKDEEEKKIIIIRREYLTKIEGLLKKNSFLIKNLQYVKNESIPKFEKTILNLEKTISNLEREKRLCLDSGLERLKKALEMSRKKDLKNEKLLKELKDEIVILNLREENLKLKNYNFIIAFLFILLLSFLLNLYIYCVVLRKNFRVKK